MRVFVAGETGAVGSYAVPALVAAGHTVTALARTPQKAAVLAEQGAEPAMVSIVDTTALTEVFAGHDAVVNLATAIPSVSRFMSASAWRENDRIRTKGSAAVVEASIAAGVDRVVQESVSMVYPDRGSQWIDERVPPDHYPLARANLAAEASANRFSDAGGTGIVLRFGWFYGPGATHSEQFFALAQHHICVVMGRPNSFVSSIHVADAGAAVAAALGADAGTFNVVDDEPLSKRSYADALAAAADKPAWVHLPGRAALLLRNRSTSLTRSLRVTNQRFKTMTGWTPRYPSAREGWIATADILTQSAAGEPTAT
jgi:nucleoside-diphosphate-sugar epimerase